MPGDEDVLSQNPPAKSISSSSSSSSSTILDPMLGKPFQGCDKILRQCIPHLKSLHSSSASASSHPASEHKKDQGGEVDSLWNECRSSKWSRLGEGKGFLGELWKWEGLIDDTDGKFGSHLVDEIGRMSQEDFIIDHLASSSLRSERIAANDQPLGYLSFVVKRPPSPTSPLYEYAMSQGLFDTEIACYQLLSAMHPHAPSIPRYLFHTLDPPCLVLEDMSPALEVRGGGGGGDEGDGKGGGEEGGKGGEGGVSNVQSLSLEEDLSFEAASQAVVELGKIHAMSLSEAEARWPDLAAALDRHASKDRKGVDSAQEEEINSAKGKDVNRVKGERVDSAVRDGIDSVLRIIYEATWPRLKEDGVYIEGFGGKWEVLEELGPKVNDIMRELAKGRSKQLTHGDFWGGNLLLEEEKVKAILDFQFSGFCEVPFLDVIMILSSSCSVTLRCTRRTELFEAYVLKGRTDLVHQLEAQKRLLDDLERYHLPLGVAFVVGFGISTIAPEGRLMERFRWLLLDYCASLVEA